MNAASLRNNTTRARVLARVRSVNARTACAHAYNSNLCRARVKVTKAKANPEIMVDAAIQDSWTMAKTAGETLRAFCRPKSGHRCPRTSPRRRVKIG